MVQGKPGKKISFVSERQVKAYRVWLLILLGVLVIAIGFSFYRVMTAGVNLTVIGVLSVYKLYDIYKGIKPVEFDGDFLYVTEVGYDVVVPLENIKYVEIKNVSGIYKVAFFDQIQSGKEIFFKPSMIYPLDFRKQDAKVNLLRSNVMKAKIKRKEPLPGNALMS